MHIVTGPEYSGPTKQQLELLQMQADFIRLIGYDLQGNEMLAPQHHDLYDCKLPRVESIERDIRAGRLALLNGLAVVSLEDANGGLVAVSELEDRLGSAADTTGPVMFGSKAKVRGRLITEMSAYIDTEVGDNVFIGDGSSVETSPMHGSEEAHLNGTESCRIGDNVDIGRFTTVRGDTFIGSNTTLGSTVLVQDSRIGSNTTIGENTSIKEARIGDRVTIKGWSRIEPLEVGAGDHPEGEATVGDDAVIADECVIFGVVDPGEHIETESIRLPWYGFSIPTYAPSQMTEAFKQELRDKLGL